MRTKHRSYAAVFYVSGGGDIDYGLSLDLRVETLSVKALNRAYDVYSSSYSFTMWYIVGSSSDASYPECCKVSLERRSSTCRLV